jgi:NodT family efflux transporter outer membrane factor (OMF) lipoprotein
VPGVDNGGGGTLDTSVESSSQRGVYGIGIGAAWEADVWGRIRSKKAAAQAESDALAADYEFARQSLAAAVARAYFSTIEASQQAANAQETMSFYNEALRLADVRKQQGHASDFDFAQIKARAASAQDALYVAQSARAQAIRAIQVVTSHYPTGRLATRSSFPDQPRGVPAGLPAQLLERRPDVIAAEQRFAAAFHRVNEAHAARLPRFAISTTAGLGTAQLISVGTLDAVTWSLAAGITQPIFFGGELKAAQDIRTAEQKAAAASYTATALRAFADVEDALASDYYLGKREGALTEVVENSATTVKLGGQQFEQGQIDTFTTLRLAGENLAAKIELTKIRASRLRERVNLHLALGGDFKGTEVYAK